MRIKTLRESQNKMSVIACAIFAFLIGSFIEWFAHKYILHNFSVKKLSRYHFGRHHRAVRQNDGYDSDYLDFPPARWESGLHEIFSLVAIVILATPLILLSSTLWYFLCVYAAAYYLLHRKMHISPEWGKKWFPWHWRHHMGKDQNANWGVTNPLFDYLFRTVRK